MINAGVSTRHRWFVPEVVQNSAMDCGPASLKCLLEGFGVSASYGRLREACQTDVDGTSINTVEEVARHAGLQAAQIMVPIDHVLLPEAGSLPAIAVVRRPSGETHFLVVWRRHGGLVQVMDPATGRRWPTGRQLLDELYIHSQLVPAAAWRRWAGSDEFLAPLRRRMANVGVSSRAGQRLINDAKADSSWRGLATVDAATRMVDSLLRSGGFRRGRSATRFLEACVRRFTGDPSAGAQAIPGSYWAVRPSGKGEDLLVHGAVVVRVEGRRPDHEAGEVVAGRTEGRWRLSRELAAALQEPPSRPGRDLFQFLRRDGLLAPAALATALFLAAGGVMVEAMLFRGLMEIGPSLGLGVQRFAAFGAALVFLVILLFLQLSTMSGLLRSGRRLETRLRLAFLRKIPRLRDRYFESRPRSDMAERGHSVHALRMLPTLGGYFLQTVFTLAVTTLALIWLDPAVAPLALTAAVLSVVVPLACQPLITERDLRVRTHAGALGRFYLDALRGLIAVRTHGAQPAVGREHEGLLVEWVRAGLGVQRAIVWIEGLVAVLGFGLAAWLLFDHVGREGAGGGVLLLVYWALNIPTLGQAVAQLARQYPLQRNVALRLMEPLGALEDRDAEGPGHDRDRDNDSEDFDDSATAPGPSEISPGVSIRLEAVCIRSAGHTILDDVNLTVEPGQHVAIVGPSGAGKSTLVGIGQLLGRVMESEAVEALALTGGFLALVAVVEIVLAAGVLVLGPGRAFHGLVFAGWLGVVILAVLRFFRTRRHWTDLRIGLTHDMVERMVGHRTRLAQEVPEHWHDGEDEAVQRYFEASTVMDRIATFVMVGIVRGWLIVGLLGLAPAIVGGNRSPAAVAVGLGGVLLAARALDKLSGGLSYLVDAHIAWRQVSPLFQAAAEPEPVGAPGLALVHERGTSEQIAGRTVS